MPKVRFGPILLSLFVSLGAFAQVQEISMDSKKLGETRKVSIYVPNEDDVSQDSHLLIVVLDANRLFDLVVANVSYFVDRGMMPSAVVVGVHQEGSRYRDSGYDEDIGLPTPTAGQFFEFVGAELVPQLEKDHELVDFKMIIGHGVTGSFINYYLLKERPLFNGYISMSPEMAPNMGEGVANVLSSAKNSTFYYLATSENDLRSHVASTKGLHTRLSGAENQKVAYYFDDFEVADHESIPAYAIPKALDQIFTMYQSITPKEYRENILTLDGPVFPYIANKYEAIEAFFGFKKKVSVNDIMAIYAACRKKEDLRSLKDLSDLARKEYPDTMMGHFFLAEYYEKDGEPKKAIKNYQKAFVLKEIDFISKDLVVNRMDAIKADFGW